MADIRTQLVGTERRIITKLVNGQRRVSCSCCEGCCMYPASQLGAAYIESDLPDSVTINWDGYSSGSASRSGSTYTVGDTTLSVVDNVWVLSNEEATQNVGSCLITGDGGLTAGDDLVEDQFAATYTSTWLGSFFGDLTLYPQRDSLCGWSATSSEQTTGGTLNSIASIVYDDNLHKWSVAWSRITPNFGIITGTLYKTTTNNTPIGTYDIRIIEGEEEEAGHTVIISA